MKKNLILLSALSFCGLAACTRVGMEYSPEAVHSYGIPSQTSNVDSPEAAKKKPNVGVSWIDSSAIVEKKTANY